MQSRLFLWILVVSLSCLCAPAQAQQRAIINSSFESNNPQGAGAPNYQIFPNGQVPGWNSTSGEIELWDSTFQGVTSYDGVVHAEMNANTGGALYQTICMVNGESVGWSFAHRNRPGGSAIQTASFQVANTSGTLIQNLATQSSANDGIWHINSGNAAYSGASGLQRVQFTTSNTGSYGNLLDDIRINLNPFVEFNAATASGVESIASANIPALVISGTLFTSRTVTVTITGGTATRGVDYTTPGGGAVFTVTIPPGVYTNTTVPLGIAIVNDTLVENSETIQMTIATTSTYTVTSTQNCGGSPVSATTYTITDDDSPVVLDKQWSTGIAGNSVSLAISGGSVSTAGSSTVGGTTSNATAVAVAGQTLTLAETYTSGNSANYTTTLNCRKNSDGSAIIVTGSGLSRTIVMPSGTAVACTFANARKSASLTLRKTWAMAKQADAANISTNGLINNVSLAAVANAANETDTATAVTVYAAEIAQLSEVWSVGNSANYATNLVCTGNSNALTGETLTVNPADSAIVCTYTNVRKSATLQLRKTWVGATVNNAVNLPATTGFSANTTVFASVANSPNESDTGTAVTIYAGDIGSIRAETYTSGNSSSYQAVLGCSGGTLAGTDALVNNSLAINSADAGRTILCTYTNTRIIPLTVTKTSGPTADGISLSNPKSIPGATIRYCME